MPSPTRFPTATTIIAADISSLRDGMLVEGYENCVRAWLTPCLYAFLTCRCTVRKLRQLSATNGWQVQSNGDLLRWLIDNAPQDVPLTDDDMMDEIRQVWQK